MRITKATFEVIEKDNGWILNWHGHKRPSGQFTSASEVYRSLGDVFDRIRELTVG